MSWVRLQFSSDLCPCLRFSQTFFARVLLFYNVTVHLKPAARLIFLCALALKSCWAIVSLCPLFCCPFISMRDLVCLCAVRVCVASIERTESCLPWARWDKAPFGGHGGHQKTQKAPHYTTEWSRARAHSPGRQSHSHYWPGTPWGEEKYKSALKREKERSTSFHLFTPLSTFTSYHSAATGKYCLCEADFVSSKAATEVPEEGRACVQGP